VAQRRNTRAHIGNAGKVDAGNPARVSEADALIAYLQMLGTQVDFKLYDDKANIR